MNFEVKTKITIKVNAYTYELTRDEAMQLLRSLQRELGQEAPIKNPFNSILLGGPAIGYSGLLPGQTPLQWPPAKTPPDTEPFDGTVTC